MAQNPLVQRAAPVTIAPKPSRLDPTPQRHESVGRFEVGASSDQIVSSLETSSLATTTVPCQSCRLSGARCFLADDDDSCTTCQASGSECSFLSSVLASPYSRKRKSNGIPHREVNFSKRSSTNMSSGKLGDSSLSSTAASPYLEELTNVGGPTMLKRSLGMQIDRFGQYIGLTTDFEPSLINLSTFDPNGESLLARGTLRKVSDDDTFLMLPDSSTPGYERIVEDVDDIEAAVSPHGHKLIDMYFRIVHPAFPIIQKKAFLETYQRSCHEVSPPVLAAVYLLAINWWDHCPELAQLPRPDVQELERLSRCTLGDAFNRPKLSTIQAGLLLSQRPEGDQWAPTAQLVAVGQELGLHLDCSNWKIPPWEKGLRRRLAWALYIQDKWAALVHGRPSHICASNWGVQALTANDFQDVGRDDEDADERQDIEKGRLLFSRFVQLSEILAEILQTFYTLTSTQTIAAAGLQSTQLVLSLAKPVQLKLKEWYSGLPADIRLESYSMTYSPASQPSTDRFSSVGYLHLGYFATEMTLHRRIIRSLASTSNTVDPYVQHICRSAAKARLISSMEFVNRLTPSHLRSFWFFASKKNFALIGTFGFLLCATSPGAEEADWYRRRLGEYRWTLSVSSKPGAGRGLTEFAMTMLDVSTGLLKKLPEKPFMSRSGSLADMSAPPPFPGSVSGPGSFLGQFSNMHSTDVSSVQSTLSEGASSDDEVEEDDSTPI